MDNQFRNVKTHARLLSKATWYEWRMKLLDGLKEGLNRHVEDMKADDQLLIEREEVLSRHVPSLVEKHASLEQEATTLQELVDEMENCDQEELSSTRSKLSEIDSEIAAKRRELELLQAEAQEKTATIEAGTEMRDEFLAQIQEAERVKEECRGWSAREINGLKGESPFLHKNGKVANLETSFGSTHRASDWLVNQISLNSIRIFSGSAIEDDLSRSTPVGILSRGLCL